VDIDLSVVKLERNTRYAHIGADGKHFQSIPLNLIVSELDTAISVSGINDPSVFLTALYQIVAHQTYHVDVDEKSGMAYSSISRALEQGAGNPRIDSLENILNGVGASLAVCKISEREDDIPHEELQRACFFQQEVKHNRWPVRETIATLFQFGLQFRIFSFEDVKKNNIIEHRVNITSMETSSDDLKGLNKAVADITSLLLVFNVSFSYELSIRPPIAEAK